MADQLDVSGLQDRLDTLNRTVAASASGLQRGTDALIKQMFNTSTGAQQMAKSAQLGVQSLHALTIGNQTAAAAVEGLADVTGQSIMQVDRVNRVYNQLSKSGATAGESLEEMMHRGSAFSLAIGASEENARAYTKVITENANNLARFGGTVRDGRRRFEESFVAMDQYRLGLQNLGYTTEEQMEGMANYMAIQTQLGVSQQMTQEQLARGSALYLRELNGLAAITGASVQQQQKNREEQVKHQQFLAQMMIMEREGRGRQAKEIQTFTGMVADLGPEAAGLAKGLRGLATGTLTLEESQELQRATGGRAADIMQRLSEGQITAIQASEEMAKAMQQNRDANLRLYAIAPDAEKTFGNLVGQNKFIDAFGNASEKAAKISEGQTKTATDETSSRAQLNQVLNQSVNSTLAAQEALAKVSPIALDTAKTFNNLRDTIQPPAIDAIGGMTKAIKQFYTGDTVGAKRSLEQSVENLGRAVSSISGQPPTPQRGGGPAAPNVAPATPQRRGAAAPGAATEGINFGGREAERTGGGAADPRVMAAARALMQMFPGTVVTAMNDEWHRNPRNMRPDPRTGQPVNSHTLGRAMDIVPPAGTRAEEVIEFLKQQGFTKVLNRMRPSGPDSGPHIHAEFAKGGIAQGPMSGFPAMLHGLEAVVPLPNNRKIPVEIPEMKKLTQFDENYKNDQAQVQQQMMTDVKTLLSDIKNIFSAQPRSNDERITKIMSDMLSATRDQNDTMQRLLQVSSN